MIKETINFYAPKPLKDKLKTLASEELISKSNLCARAVEYYIKNYATIRKEQLNCVRNV